MGGQQDPAPDRIAELVLKRDLQNARSGSKAHLLMTVTFRAALPPELRSELAAERLELSRRRGPGTLAPRSLEISADGRAARAWFDPFDEGAVRLDLLLDALRAQGSTGGSSFSALLAGATAARLSALHEEAVAHGDLAPRHVLIGPGGGVAVVCAGLPVVRALVIPQEPRASRLRRRAPEVLLGASPTPASDVYALGALYYELLSGEAYRGHAGVAALRGAARARLDPELPGALPDPRPALVQLLRACLSNEPERRPSTAMTFLAELKAELSASRLALADRPSLARLLEEYVPEETPRGPRALIDDGVPAPRPLRGGENALEDAPQGVFLEGGQTSTEPPPLAAPGGWAAVLGDEGAFSPTPDPPGPGAPEARPPADRRLGDDSPLAARASMGEARAVYRAEEEAPTTGDDVRRRPGALRLPPLSADPVEAMDGALPKAALGGAVAGPALPGSPATGRPRPAIAPLLAPGAGLIEAMSERPRPPTLDEAARLSPRAWAAIFAAGVGLVGLVFLVGTLREGSAHPGAGGGSLGLPAAASKPERRAKSEKDESVAGQGLQAASDLPAATPSREDRARRSAPPARPAREAEPRALGLVTVMSNPSGATVLIDGGYVGTTPLVLKHTLKPKTYRVTVSAEGFLEWSENVRPKNGSLSVVASLVPRE